MNGPELPPDLQADQDRYYRELHGPPEKMLFVETWHGSTMGMEIGGTQLWFMLLRVDGATGPYVDPDTGLNLPTDGRTLAVPLDIAGNIGRRMVRATKDVQEGKPGRRLL